jgi:hypothetical protein
MLSVQYHHFNNSVLVVMALSFQTISSGLPLTSFYFPKGSIVTSVTLQDFSCSMSVSCLSSQYDKEHWPFVLQFGSGRII